jgi:hypothetical protein
VRRNGVEALRGIAFLIRDRNWGTYTPRIDSPSVTEGAGSFTVESLRRPLEGRQLNLDAYALARVEVDNNQAP